MKKHILNRPMFRQVKSPAYGTGIAANLVTEQQRIKYNSGGRVKAGWGLFASAAPWAQRGWAATKAAGPKISQWWKTPSTGFGSGELGILKGVVNKSKPFGEGLLSFGKKFPTLSAYGVGTGTSGIGEERDFSLNPLKWFGGGDEEEEKTKVDESEFLKERRNKLNQLRTTDQKPPKVVDTEVVEEESDVLGLDPEDRAAMEASILSQMGQGALTSKGESGWDVVKDALAGATGEISKQTDPREYRKWKTKGKEERKLREEDRKWAEKQEAKKIARAQDPANIAQVLEFEGNLSHVAAINKAYGSNIKEKPPAGKENKKQVEQFRLTLKEGDVFFDPDTNKYKMVKENNQTEELSETEAIEITRRRG
jgi:hypothetical protein